MVDPRGSRVEVERLVVAKCGHNRHEGTVESVEDGFGGRMSSGHSRMMALRDAAPKGRAAADGVAGRGRRGRRGRGRIGAEGAAGPRAGPKGAAGGRRGERVSPHVTTDTAE